MDEKYIDQVHKLSSDVVVLKEEMINIIKSKLLQYCNGNWIDYFSDYAQEIMIKTEEKSLKVLIQE